MIRPWYRSRLFWFGLPAMIFWLWLWAFSPQRAIVLGRGGQGLELGALDGALRLGITDMPGSGQDLRMDVVKFDRPVELSGPWAYWEVVRPAWGLHRKYVLIVSWLPVATYAAGWLGIVAARQSWKVRRMRSQPHHVRGIRNR